MMQSQKLFKLIEQEANFLLIDIRENYEYSHQNIGGKNIPLGEILTRLDEIPKNIPVIIHCQSGARGKKLVAFLESMDYNNIENLEGGIEAYFEIKQQHNA